MVGPIWPGSRDPFARRCPPPKPDGQLGRDEDVPYRSRRRCLDASPRMAQQRVGERHWCPPKVSLSLCMT